MGISKLQNSTTQVPFRIPDTFLLPLFKDTLYCRIMGLSKFQNSITQFTFIILGHFLSQQRDINIMSNYGNFRIAKFYTPSSYQNKRTLFFTLVQVHIVMPNYGIYEIANFYNSSSFQNIRTLFFSLGTGIHCNVELWEFRKCKILQPQFLFRISGHFSFTLVQGQIVMSNYENYEIAKLYNSSSFQNFQIHFFTIVQGHNSNQNQAPCKIIQPNFLL